MKSSTMAAWLVAGVVALGAFAVHADDPASETKTKVAALKHRWTFNEDFRDEVTGRAAVKIGANVAVADGVAKMTGAGNSTGSLNLGMDVMPPGAATVEIWAKQTATKNYSRIFDYGPNDQNYFTMSWSTGTDINKDLEEIKYANTAILRKDNTLFPYSLGTQYHISVVFTPKGDGSCDVRWAKRNVTTGAIEKSGSGNAPNWALGALYRPYFYLGHSQYSGDHDANAEYDEVRIWNGALTDAQLNANAAAGPNSLPETVTVAPAVDNAYVHLRQRWSFNGNYNNALPGRPAAAGKGKKLAWADSNTTIQMSGTKNQMSDNNNGGYVELGVGGNILPSDSMTIEIWATPTAAKSYARVFDMGGGETDGILLSWVRGTNTGQDAFQVKRGGSSLLSVNDSFGGFALNTKWHIAVSYRDMGNGNTMVHWTKRNAATGRIVRNRWALVTGWTIAELRTYTLNIGHSFYKNDIDANAKYDEVRIWNGALSDETLAESARLGPTTLPGVVRLYEPPRTVCVAEKTADSVTLAFGNPNGRNHALFLASGATDGDDDKYAWESFEKVADIVDGQETYTYEVPAALRDGRPLRFFLLQTTGLAMAKELDKVHSTGAQWVNADLVPDGRTVTDFRFGNVTYVNSTAFFGQNWTGSRYLFNQQGDKFYFHASGSAFGAKPALNTNYRFIVDDDNHVSLFTNGAETRVAPSNTRNVDANNPMGIFACNDNKNFSTFDFYRMKIANSGWYDPYPMQRDYIPALDANDVPGLYDQVNDKFYPSSTETALVAGTERDAARFGRVTDMTPTFRFLPTVAVTEQTATTATLAFGNGASGSNLFIAYGATDGGADKNAWANFEDLGAIAADETTRTVTLPAALQATGLKYRFFLVKTSDLPYASEVASFTSTGGQTVRTGYIPDITTTFDFRISGLTYANDNCLFGQGWNGCDFLLCVQGNYYRWYGSGTNLDPAANMSEPYRIQLFDGPVVRMDHGTSHREYGVRLAPNPVLDVGVFGTWSVTRGSKYTFNSLKLKDAGMLVRDLVPVVKANGKGALFDNVNGILYSNELESNDFTKGATLTRTGWVQNSTASLNSFAAADAGRVATAHWIGGGDVTDLADPANWKCWDATGAELPATALPDSGTAVDIDGAASISCPVGATPSWASVTFGAKTGRVTLTADCDWRGLGALNVASGTVIDLNGHTLYVYDIVGDGSVTVTDSILERANLITNGSFESFDGTFTGTYAYFTVGGFQPTGWNATTSCGLAVKNNTWVANTPIDGTFVCWLQNAASIFQYVTVPESGEYTLTFKLAARPNLGCGKLTVDVDGTTVRTWGAVNNTVFEEQIVTLNLTAGEHEIKFQGYLIGSDSTSLIDDVKLLNPRVTAGELHIDVAEGVTKDNVAYVVDGGLTFVKTGAGTFTAANYIRNSGGAVVNAGTFAMGATSLVPIKYPIRVMDGAAYDVAGNGNGNCPVLTMEGTGPDGNGCLRNSGGDVTSGSAQVAGIILTGNATAYSSNGDFGLLNSGYAATDFDMHGYTLTINVPTGKHFWMCNAASSCEGLIHVTNGSLYFHNSTVNLPNVDAIIDGENSKVEVPAVNVYLRDLVMDGGSTYVQTSNRMHVRNLFFNDATKISSSVSWIYVSDNVIVSNETTDITCAAPITNNGTYPKLVKYGAAKFNITNNHTDQRMDGGAEIFGGMVVMDSTASTVNPSIAISSQPVPVTIHAGGTLDMRKCVNPVKLTSLEVDDGGAILATTSNIISFPGNVSFSRARPFSFAGTVSFGGTATFDLSGMAAPEGDADVVLLEVGMIDGLDASEVVATGCPEGYEVVVTSTRIVLSKNPSAVAAKPEIKIWTIGGNYVYGGTYCFRGSLAQSFAASGWNVRMTGWRTANANALCAGVDAWKRHAGVQNLALKTTATRAGLLEGLETFCAAANYPDFTVFICGDIDVADEIADATVLANYKEAVTRIKAALPMTTVIACTIPGGSAALNADISSWCGEEANVECVDIASLITTAQAQAECEAVAAAIKAKLMTLATAEGGKNTPSGWTPPAVVLDATNNVPAAYLDGFTRVRTIEPTPTLGFAQNLYGIPYTYAPPMQETGIAKVGYYIELVRKDTGALQAMWIDMDAPGSTWADVALPVTHAQRKQKTVTKLHVWSNFGGVKQVAADDDSVEGYIEFNPVNYGGGDRTGDVLAEPWSGGICGFNDTLTETGDSGHGCFQLMRKYAEPDGVLPGEILFAYNRWGSTAANPRAIGMGTLADFGNLGHSSSKTLDWTFTYGADTADVANISANAYSHIRIEFWLKYDGSTPDRSAIADYIWTPATEGESTFATVGNWAKNGTTATSLANAPVLLPSGASQAFTYVGWDPVSLTTTRLMVDGAASFNDVGGFYLSTLDIGATGKVTYDPTKFTFRLVGTPVFTPGAKIALDQKYAANTKGRFLLMTWDSGSLNMDDAALTALFDASSASGNNPKVWVESLANGSSRLWLDLDYGAPKTRVNVLPVGDSITHGGGYGNWRTGLMKKLAAAGYEPIAKGHRYDQSNDICGAAMPDEWISHSGIGGQRLISSGGGGTIDAIENFLDQAGDVDFVLVKLGTNDINSGTKTPGELFPVWSNLVEKVITQKTTAKFIAGAVVDIADAAKNAKVVTYNTMMREAIEGGMFPAKRVYFADLYTPCYRYDAQGNYITGSFQSATDLHPDWPGEDKMADVYCKAITDALADDPDFTPGQAEVVPTTSGAENNVPAAYLAGFTRARVFDVAAHNKTPLASNGYVPYDDIGETGAATENVGRVGYYIEIRRKDDGVHEYHGLTRWLWVSMDAFGDRLIDTLGVPIILAKKYQGPASHLHIASNMPGIETTAATGDGADGWVEFWPSSYGNGASGIAGAPAKTYGYDWNDTCSGEAAGHGSMQVHRLTPGEYNPAQVLFALSDWGSGTAGYAFGLGNMSHQSLGSRDWTFAYDTGKLGGSTRLSAQAYEVAKIEIWTTPGTVDMTARWTGGGDGTTLTSAANWECRDVAGKVVENAVPNEHTTVIIDGATSFSVPEGTEMNWKGVQIGEDIHSYTQMGYIKYAGRSAMGNDNWKNVLLKHYMTQGVGDLTELNAYGVPWSATYINEAQVRYDGWVYVSAEEAGTWNINQRYDDYYGFAIDGAWKHINNTYNANKMTNFTIAEGWHKFTIVCGDTTGGEGANGASNGMSYNGMPWPMLVSVNGGEYVPFTPDHFTMGTGRNVVTLNADCDWRGLGTVTIPSGAAIDLNGHTLKVKGLSADGYLGAEVTSPWFDGTVAAPSILSSACFWLDASDASTLNIDSAGRVLSWTSKDSSHRVATAPAATAQAENFPIYDATTYGRPTVDFGKTSSQRDMTYTRFTNLRTVFMVIKVEATQRAFLLGDRNGGSGTYNFHRGDGGQYGHSSHAKFSNVWNGTTVVDWKNDVIPADDFQVISIVTSQNSASDSLTFDRSNSVDSGYRNGGRQLSELICFNSVLSDAERTEVVQYLQRKWMLGGTQGTLIIDVPEGVDSANDGVAICGNVKVVKEGAGAYEASAGSTYMGGTDVREGMFRLGTPTVTDGRDQVCTGTLGAFGTDVTVQPGATLDAYGAINNYKNRVILNGGTLANTAAISSGSSYSHWGNVTLTADSYTDFVCGGMVRRDGTPVTVDLGGYTLHWNGRGQSGSDWCWMLNTDITAGTLEVDGFYTVYYLTDNTKGIRAPQTTLVVKNSGILAIDREPMTVKDYICANTVDGAAYSANSLTVSGTFRPESNRHWGCTLASGATLDLTAWTGAWNATSVGGRTVVFPTTEGATVTVKLGDRKDLSKLAHSDDPYAVKWSAAPVNTTFKVDSAASRRGYRLRKEEGGLRLSSIGGSAIFFR